MSDDQLAEISREERARFAKSAKQLVAYTNFLRWSANFPKEELRRHPQHDQVILLSPMQSSRFSFAMEGNTLLLGVQHFEAAWMAPMPFECAYVSDRLYLSVSGVTCMSAKLPPMTLGIFVNDSRKRAQMSTAEFVQPTRVTVQNGRIEEIGRAFGLGFPLNPGNIIEGLVAREKARSKTMDVSRFF